MIKKILNNIFSKPKKDVKDLVTLKADTLLTLPNNTQSPMYIGIFVLLFGFLGFIIWASLAPLDEGVPTTGSVSISTKRKVIQHATGGIVEKVFVQEGQVVKQNDILIKLDDASSKAKFEETRQQYISLRARESRIMAEISGAKTIEFHPYLLSNASDPLVKLHMENQIQLWTSRQNELSADLSILKESILRTEEQINGLNAVLIGKETQQNLMNTQLSNLIDLVKEGYAPRVQQNELEQKVAQLKSDVADTKSSIHAAKKSIGELNQKIQSRKQGYQVENDKEMMAIRQQVQAYEEKLSAISDELSRSEIRAPVSGQVIDLKVQTIGGIIQQGEKIMDIVPIDETLMLEAKIPPQFIDSVKVGQFADIRFSSFAHSPQLFVQGKVESVSKDLIFPPNAANQPDTSYYLARISITQDGLKTLSGKTLQPGMPVQVVIVTGERSLMKYIMHPLIKRMSSSLKEE